MLLALVSLLVLVLLRGVLAPVPAALFLATLGLFLVPGIVLSRLAPGTGFSGAARLPLAFALSTGLYGLPAIPFLVLHRSFGEYLVVCAALLAASLTLALRWALRPPDDATEPSESASSLAGTVLWLPFAGLAAALAYTSSRVVPPPEMDHWAYLAYVREFVGGENLGRYNPFFGDEVTGFSRIWLDGWLMEQAAFSRLSGIDPVPLISNYLNPALVIVSLLAFYALARVLFENTGAALLTSSLYALFLIFYLELSPDSFGGVLVRRVMEDKFAARYLLLPVALSLAVAFLRYRKWRYLALFTFVFWSMGAVHPLLMGILGISLAGFGLIFVLVNRREPGSWMRMGALGGVMLATVAPPAVYLLATGSQLLSKLETLDAAAIDYRLRIWESQDRLLLLGDGGSYIMHPALVLNPVIAAAYLLGVPFLIWRLERSLAAQLLLGTLLFTPVLVYVPPVATFVGQFIGPWLIYRLAWPIPLAALLTVGWMTWKALEYASERLSRLGLPVRSIPLLPLALVVLLSAFAAPRALAGIRTMDATDETAVSESTCQDPAFEWMRNTIGAPTVVLAPEAESSCVPAYTSRANVLSYRNQLLEEATQDGDSSRAQEAEAFFDSDVVSSSDLDTLSRHEVGYVLLPADSPLNVQLGHLPGFAPLENPGNRYRVYGVDGAALATTPAVQGNDLLANGDVEAAIDAYAAALGANSGEQVLAYVGLGQAYEEWSQAEYAAANYEEAASLNQDEPVLRSLLAEAYQGAGQRDLSLLALQNGLERFPENVGLRIELASSLRSQDPEAAIEIHRPVVERFPEVPEYRIKMGRILAANGDEEAADRAFRRAVRLSPLSAELQADVAEANQLAGREQAATRYYKRALELEPENPAHAFNLGTTYARLAPESDQAEKYYRRSERYLERAAELEPLPGRFDLQAAAWISLGDLYVEQDRLEDAREAYEKALDVDPDSTRAQQKLEELQGRQS